MAVTILITRPEDAAIAFADQVRARLGCGVSIVIAPILQITYLSSLPEMDDVRVVIFTPMHAVRAFAALTEDRGFTCYTVGTATAEAARAEGFDPIAGDGTGTSLSQRIIRDRPPGPCLYVHGEHVAFDMRSALNSAGIETKEAVLYRQKAVPLTEAALNVLRGESPVIVPLFSPRSARLFFGEDGCMAPLFVAAMSDNVAQEIPASRVIRLELATEPTAQAMLDAVERLYGAAIQLEGSNPAH